MRSRYYFQQSMVIGILALLTIMACQEQSDRSSFGLAPEELAVGPEEPHSIANDYVDITHLGNQGVMITDGVHKVIVDGLHRAAGELFAHHAELFGPSLGVCRRTLPSIRGEWR